MQAPIDGARSDSHGTRIDTVWSVSELFCPSKLSISSVMVSGANDATGAESLRPHKASSQDSVTLYREWQLKQYQFARIQVTAVSSACPESTTSIIVLTGVPHPIQMYKACHRQPRQPTFSIAAVAGPIAGPSAAFQASAPFLLQSPAISKLNRLICSPPSQSLTQSQSHRHVTKEAVWSAEVAAITAQLSTPGKAAAFTNTEAASLAAAAEAVSSAAAAAAASTVAHSKPSEASSRLFGQKQIAAGDSNFPLRLDVSADSKHGCTAAANAACAENQSKDQTGMLGAQSTSRSPFPSALQSIRSSATVSTSAASPSNGAAADLLLAASVTSPIAKSAFEIRSEAAATQLATVQGLGPAASQPATVQVLGAASAPLSVCSAAPVLTHGHPQRAPLLSAAATAAESVRSAGMSPASTSCMFNSVSLVGCLSVCLAVCLSGWLSVHLSVCPSACLPA